MSNIFNLDAPIWVFMGEVADIIILALLWWICSLGIITIGASTTALYYVIGKKIRKEQTYVAKDFFKSFKQNFRQSVPLTVLTLIAFVSLGLYVSFIFANNTNASASYLRIIIPVTILFAFEVLNFNTYIWAVLSRFDVPTGALIRTTFILIHKHLLTTLCNLGVIVVVCIGVLQFPIIITVAPGAIVWGQSFMLQSVFSKYITAANESEKEEQTGEVNVEEITASESVLQDQPEQIQNLTEEK